MINLNELSTTQLLMLLHQIEIELEYSHDIDKANDLIHQQSKIEAELDLR